GAMMAVSFFFLMCAQTVFVRIMGFIFFVGVMLDVVVAGEGALARLPEPRGEPQLLADQDAEGLQDLGLSRGAPPASRAVRPASLSSLLSLLTSDGLCSVLLPVLLFRICPAHVAQTSGNSDNFARCWRLEHGSRLAGGLGRSRARAGREPALQPGPPRR
ncbi:unnamed protein product, partial [Prorocentrum cordatum]